MEKEQLIKEIAKYCEEKDIMGSVNIPYGDYSVSFDIKLKKTYCKECGRKLDKEEK